MTQLIVTIEDLKLLPELERAIRMLRGVKDITVCDTTDISNETTKQAIKEWQEGKTVKCKDFEEYLMKVK